MFFFIVPKMGTSYIEEMRVIKKPTLIEFYAKHADAKNDVLAWYAEATTADWKSPHDIVKEYPTASIIKGSRVVFNIRNNDYRLVVKIHYHTGIVYIRFIGTHKQYDAIHAETI